MYAAISQSDAEPRTSAAQRATGHGRVRFKPFSTGETKLDRLYQQGCAKIRLPKTYGTRSAEAVLINSSGGLTGGDDMRWELSCGTGTHAVATTQACEKLYKSDGGTAQVATQISVEDGARCDWLPQETILFNQSGLQRSLDVDLIGSARFLAVEALLLGRIAMGERVHAVDFSDNWLIRRDGKLIHADALRFEGDITASGAAASSLAGHNAFASLCYCGPEDEEYFEHLTERARTLLNDHDDCSIGISSFNCKLIARVTAPEGIQLRKALIPLINMLRGGEPLPRVWTT